MSPAHSRRKCFTYLFKNVNGDSDGGPWVPALPKMFWSRQKLKHVDENLLTDERDCTASLCSSFPEVLTGLHTEHYLCLESKLQHFITLSWLTRWQLLAQQSNCYYCTQRYLLINNIQIRTQHRSNRIAVLNTLIYERYVTSIILSSHSIYLRKRVLLLAG